MGQFVHNNVVQLHGVVTEEENMMIVLEYMPKGDLQNILLKTRIVYVNTPLLVQYCEVIGSGCQLDDKLFHC